MEKLILASLLAAVSTMAAAEIKVIGQINDFNLRSGTMMGFYDTVSEQYCLLYDGGRSSNMKCKALHELSEQAQRNILGDSYIPKSGVGTCEASQDNCPKN